MQATLSRPADLRPIIAIIILLAVGSIGTVIGTSISHAEKHSSADQAHKCFDQNGHVQVWMKWSDDYRARICDDGRGNISIQIIRKISEKWQEVTAWTERNSLSDVGGYLERQGYSLWWKR